MSEQEKNTKQAFGCEACWPETAEAAWEMFGKLQTRARLIDESHYIVSLRQCTACGQSFVSVFTETVDWIDGEDPQYRTVMPLTEQEATALEAREKSIDGMLRSLTPERRALKIDFPKGAPQTQYWSQGI